ncbi:MAG TPA: sulfate ABC transporter ATP-binding protein [Candidatus Hydrogenedentes bacterium]|nr:sulfate ABC transporter ATP-binding protein [Candidatus Hydrogenedentota bacterium]HNT88900.1 sulfate ABC transporter ATP-binding protein [Candidatus Hydrogenedentota bacterium]
MSIEVRHITKTFGRFKALDDVSLEAPDGELMALLGPSGSGKTTLLRIIAGLDRPDPRPESEILFHQENVARRGAGQRHVGFVFQHYALFRHMTVFENIAFGMRVRPRSARPAENALRARVRELLRLIQLENLENRYPNQLSGGQRQRVALARALAIEPKVLLLDEPFGALDAKVRQELRRWLRRLHDEIHVTSIFVTHDQEEALEVADRVVVMNEGRIEQVGAPEEVFHRPATEFVMRFLGNVNLFHGRVESGDITFGPFVLGRAAQPVPDGKEAHAFVRPYDLEIRRDRAGGPALDARVARVLSAGPVVKVELKTDNDKSLFVEVPHDRYRALNLARDERVFVSVRDARVFVEDYVI